MRYPQSIIVRAPNRIGDHVMACPFYEGLRKAYPEARITLLGLENISTLEVGPWFDECIVFNRSERNTPRGLWQMARKLSGRFSLGICLPASFSSALLFFMAGIPHRVGFSQGGNDLFFTASMNWKGRESGKHKSSLYRELLDFLLAGSSPLLDMDFPLNKKEAASENIILVAPGASHPVREWPYYQTLLNELRKRYWAFRFVVVGAGDEEKWHGILKRMNDSKIEDWVDSTSLVELVELCKRAKLVICNDSGVAHLAATLAGSRVLVIFGPGDPDYVRPVGKKVEVVRLVELPCSPCESTLCSERWGYQQCLRQLSPEVVLEKVQELLRTES